MFRVVGGGRSLKCRLSMNWRYLELFFFVIILYNLLFFVDRKSEVKECYGWYRFSTRLVGTHAPFFAFLAFNW